MPPPLPEHAGSGGPPNRQNYPKFPNNPCLVHEEENALYLAALLPALEKHGCLEHPAVKPKRSPWVKAFVDLHHPAGPWGSFSNAPNIESNVRYNFKSYKIPKIYEQLEKYEGTNKVHLELREALKQYYDAEKYYKEYMAGSHVLCTQEMNKPACERAPIPGKTAAPPVARADDNNNVLDLTGENPSNNDIQEQEIDDVDDKEAQSKENDMEAPTEADLVEGNVESTVEPAESPSESEAAEDVVSDAGGEVFYDSEGNHQVVEENQDEEIIGETEETQHQESAEQEGVENKSERDEACKRKDETEGLDRPPKRQRQQEDEKQDEEEDDQFADALAATASDDDNEGHFAPEGDADAIMPVTPSTPPKEPLASGASPGASPLVAVAEPETEAKMPAVADAVSEKRKIHDKRAELLALLTLRGNTANDAMSKKIQAKIDELDEILFELITSSD